jgi:O-antigen/teichoic acid export membrane protein
MPSENDIHAPRTDPRPSEEEGLPPDEQRKSGVTRLFKDSLIYGSGSIVQKFSAVFLLPLYTSYLSPATYGVFGMVTIFATTMDVVVNLGLNLAIPRFYFDDDSETYRSRLITNAFFVSVVYRALILGALAIFMPQISRLLMHGHAEYAKYFDIALLQLYFNNLTMIALMLFRLDHKPWVYSAFSVARLVVQVPLTLVLLTTFHMGLMGALWGWTATSIFLAAVSLPTYWKRLSWSLNRELTRSLMAFAIPSLVAELAFVLLKFSDRFLLNRYTTLTEVGKYVAANNLSQPVYMALAAFNIAWPQWHFKWLHDEPRHKRLVAQGSTFFILASCFLVAVMAVYMPLFIRLLLHRPAYWSVGYTTIVLCIGIVAYGFYYIFWVGAQVAKKSALLPVIGLAAAGTNIGLNVVLIPRYGMIAAAYTTLIGFALLAGLMLPISRRYYRIRYEWLRFAKTGLATAVTIAAAWGIARLLGERTGMPLSRLVPREAAKTAALLLFPATLFALRFFTAGEMAGFGRGWRRLTRRPAPAAASVPPAAPQSGVIADVLRVEDEELEVEAAARLGSSDGSTLGP